MESIQKQLEGLGLSSNEVKIYTASLEIGAATAQQLAAKAAVVRPTAYVAIGGLVKHGLMSPHTRGKKQFFQAESPEILLTHVENKKKKIVEDEQKLRTLIPRIKALISIAGVRPDIGIYEGIDGLETMRATLFAARSNELLVIGSPEKYATSVSNDSVQEHNSRLEKAGIRIKQIVLYTTNKPRPAVKGSIWRYLKMAQEESGEMAIFGDHAAFTVYLDKPYGFLIKSREMVRVLKSIFIAGWKSSEKF